MKAQQMHTMHPFFPSKLSSVSQEGTLQGSKAIKYPMLLDIDEMKSLLEVLSPSDLFIVSQPVSKEDAWVSFDQFLQFYAEYINSLKAGVIPNEEKISHYFSTILTKDYDEVLYAMPVGKQGKYLIKVLKPVVQLQQHHFYFSPLDSTFHSMVMSEESVTWGIQFSYPTLCQDPKTQQIKKVVDSEEFPNTELFSKLTKWVRGSTQPTPFVWKGRRINVPMRLGKNCFSWINQHPGLRKKGLEVHKL